MNFVFCIISIFALWESVAMAAAGEWDPPLMEINDRQLYRLIPKTKMQLGILERAVVNNTFELVLWNGVHGIGDPVEILATQFAMEKFIKTTKLNLVPQLVYPFVQIKMEKADPNSGVFFEKEATTITTDASEFAWDPEMSSSIRPIPGTDLYTGLWYTMSMESFPQGFVTWTEATNDYKAHFIQIDLTPDHLAHYSRGEKWFHDAQWRFTISEDPDWYTWENRVLSTTKNAITTWSYKETANGYHIIASTKPEDVGFLSADGKWRIHALWRPLQVGDGNGYKLVNKNFPQGTITWTGQKYGNYSHYIQVDTNPAHEGRYRQGGKWFVDSIFTFKQTESVEVNV